MACLAVSCSGSSIWSTSDERGVHGPAQESFWSATSYATLHGELSPAGANLWDCRPTKAHPRPVVLVHGTWVDQYQSFAKLAPRLAEHGYCVFSLNLGKLENADYLMAKRYGAADIQRSAQELAAFVQRVKDRTKTEQVDLVGWSQGGVIIRSYLKYEGGASLQDPEQHQVKRVVTLGSPHRGTTLSGLASLVVWGGWLDYFPELIGPAGTQLVTGSPFLRALNEGGETYPGIEYTSIYTPFDAIVNPPENARLTASPGATVRNINVHEGCESDFSTHEALPFSERSIALTMRALDPDADLPVPCEIQIGSVL